MGKLIVKRRIDVELEYATCLKCGCDDVDFGDCGYSTYNVGYGKCMNEKCGHTVNVNCEYNPDKEMLIREWNKKNDITILISQKTTEMNSLKKELSELKKIQRKRSNKHA